ncbi:MAG TPA: hypothetical protein VG034_26360 [Acidimicrobiia bacterium]|nr:hypothetical protein [Acidimicrobiia bacterium]
MIELDAVIEPEAVPPAGEPRRRCRAVVVGATLLALLAGGIAVAAGGGRSEPKPLALMAGNGAGFGAETMAARSGSPAPATAPAQGEAADSRAAIYPYGGWGIKFEVEGQLPDLPDHAAAWRVNGPTLDRAAIARIAEALYVEGTPVQRDGGWFVDGGDWTLSAFGGDASGKGGPWSINLYRNRFNGQPDDAARDTASTGPAISRTEAEQRVGDLLDRMDAPVASWRFVTTETEIGVGWACAAPVPAMRPEELKKLEAEKLRQLDQSSAVANAPHPELIGPIPADMPAPGANVASCPPPPPPLKGFNVALFPVLDGRRADWPVWNVTLRSDGRIEGLYGSWVTFERAGDYKLRGVDAALKDLQSPPVAYATDMPAAIEPDLAPPAQTSAGAIDGSGTAGSAPSRTPLKDDGVASSPAVGMPVEAPVCPPAPMPLPAQDDRATSSMAPTCAPPIPQVVKITGVELGLIQTSVFEDGQVRLALVPSYRFVGHFDNGTPWEASVIALHPDAIAPPPDYPVTGDVRSGGGSTGVGKAVPPTPPVEPAVVRE